LAKYNLFIGPGALADVQDAMDYYDEVKDGLGSRFVEELDEELKVLEVNPFFEIRYDAVRCLPMKKFPFMIHFSVDESKNELKIRAILHTSRSPKVWKKR
jgi:hypothetical protein